MPRFRLAFLAALVIVATALPAHAQEPIRFARTPDISPDGKLVTFSYLGDIWVVDAIGGVARPVTMHEKHEINPVFSPDGKRIAFSSNRHGSYDVFVVPVQGGRPERLTFDSADDMVNDWSPDGQSILFTSNRGYDFPPRLDLYTVPVAGGKSRRVSAFEGKEGTFSPDGNFIAYVRGPGTWYRKYYHGSSNDDLWLSHADGTNNRRLTTHPGQDTSPMFAPDGKTLYYVSDVVSPPGSPTNIVRQPLDGGSPPQAVTRHTEDSVRKARISRNGQWIVYECGPDLWLVSTTGGTPRKLVIEAYADDRTNPDRTVTFTTSASEFAVDGKDAAIAFVVHGQIFARMIKSNSNKARRLTDSRFNDHSPVWSPDGKKLIFLSDRDGHENIWLLESADPSGALLMLANTYKQTQLTRTDASEQGINFSPDGRRISFLRNGKLLTMNVDGSDVKTIVQDTRVIDYEWSPDSKWIAFARLDGSFASEIYIVPAGGPTGTDPIRNVTRYAMFNAGITWSTEGNKLAFLTERRANAPQTMYVMSLQKPAVPSAPSSSQIDWEDIHLRVFQPANMDVQEGAISPDGKRIAFRSHQNGDDLWIATVDGKEVTRMTTGNMKPTQITWSKGSSVIFFKDGGGNLRMTSAYAGFGPPQILPFSAKMTIKRDEEFAEMFDQSWRALNENFYDPNFHGKNWIAIRAKYQPLVKHVALREDFYDLISLMLGELNASHLGIMGPPSAPEETTADLGLIFDESWRGPGLKVAEIIKRGPADKRGLELQVGDIILSIDRVRVNNELDLAKALNDRADEPVICEVTAAPVFAKIRRLELLAVDRRKIRPLMYDRWVEHNARRVAQMSKGKLGYIHIPSMDDAGLERFVRALYSDNTDKEGIVLDVRFNGGGNTHDQVLNYLGGKEHTFFYQRNGGMGTVLTAGDRKWNKPLVLLINNRSYSDAEIFPHAFRTLGLGKLIGQPTGGMVIGTTSIRLIDGSLFRIPRTGVFTIKGINMEREGVTPDYIVDVNPDDLARGIDPQLDKAVSVLQGEVSDWKKKMGGPLQAGPGGQP
jgi:tricorn protease